MFIKSVEDNVDVIKYKDLVVNGGFYEFLADKFNEYGISCPDRSYATARKCTMSTTFDEATCKQLIGKHMPGSIKKVEAEPYEYTVPKTGQVITLDYRYEFSPEEDNTSMEAAVFQPELAI